MSVYSLFKSFVYGMLDYMAQHNANYTIIEGALNDLSSMITGAAGGQTTVPLGLKEIFDRRGLIGIDSYDFTTGTLTGPNYNFTVAIGAYYNNGYFYHKVSTTVLSMAGRSAGTYYLNLDALGNPVIGASADVTTSRQFYWNGTNQTSAKALYTGVNILFDGDDQADCLTSAARSKTFTKIADRFEEIEVLLGNNVQTPASADTININWSLGGIVRVVLDRASTTLNFSGAYDGQKLVLELTQDATGGRVVVFGSEVLAGTDFTLPIPLSGANKTDLVGFIYKTTNNKYRYSSLARGYDY